MATCEFCADELPEGARFCPSCGASAGGGTRCRRCHAANALMAVHCNQCGTLLAEDIMASGAALAPAMRSTNEPSSPAEPAKLPEWLFLEDEAPAPTTEPPPAMADGAGLQEPPPTPEVDIPAGEDLDAALRELSRPQEPAPPPREESSIPLSGDLAAALRDLPLDLPSPREPREEPAVPPPRADDLDKALRDLLGQPAPAPEPPPPPRLEEEGEFYRWLQQAMQDAPPGEGEEGRGKGQEDT